MIACIPLKWESYYLCCLVLSYFPFSGVKEEYRKLEVLAFEMETTIASLEEELTISHAENEEANSRAENLACELQALSDELNMSNTELSMLKEEVSCLVSLYLLIVPLQFPLSHIF